MTILLLLSTVVLLEILCIKYAGKDFLGYIMITKNGRLVPNVLETYQNDPKVFMNLLYRFLLIALPEFILSILLIYEVVIWI